MLLRPLVEGQGDDFGGDHGAAEVDGELRSNGGMAARNVGHGDGLLQRW